MSPATNPAVTSPQIASVLEKLRDLSRRDVQGGWHLSRSPHPRPPSQGGEGGLEKWPLVAVNGRGHVAWQQGRRVLWLHQRLIWPQDLGGYPVVGLSAKLALRWWAEGAEIYVNGQLAHTGDIFDCWTRINLSESVKPGESVEVALKLVSPGHDDGALVKSELVFESLDEANPEPAFVADELAVLETYLRQFAPEKLGVLEDALTAIAWDQVGDAPRFHQSLNQMRDTLSEFSPWLKQRTVHCVGHAHLDLAWLWPVAETWDAAQRTFESVLALQQDFPELTFTHSTPALFAWIEENRPDLFTEIQQQVQAGRWAIDAGLWVEPDLNLPGGEALVRQILYGQRYCAEKFGAMSALAWLPDTFGFSWQLPQLLTQGGVGYFATQKLRWNDRNPFPHDLFTWQGLDGTPITAVTLPPIGTDIEAPEIAQYAAQWEANTGFQDALWLPGVGDHGGGPTRDMLIKARRWANSPLFPRLTFGHAQPLLDALLTPPTAAAPLSPVSLDPHPPVPPSPPLPLWRDELYLELHRGCYTTHGDQKQYNRRCEDTLFQAELWSTIAHILSQCPYPKAELEIAWKQVLFNQFHDILPGSSIPEVFADANETWQAALASGQQILANALEAVAQAITLPPAPDERAIPVVLFNPLNWERDEVVEIFLPEAWADSQHWQALDSLGREIPVQWRCPHPLSPPLPKGEGEAKPVFPAPLSSLGEGLGGRAKVLVTVTGIPSVGYRVIWLKPITADLPTPHAPRPTPPNWVLENDHLRATLDSKTGEIASLIHKATGTETFSAAGNPLQAFKDAGQYWDAWNIAPDYPDHPLDGFCLQSMEWVEAGPCRQVIRVVKTFNQSTFVQDYVLDATATYLRIRTTVDWQETQVLVKAAFPLTVSAPQATYEIPFGAIQRPTHPQTPEDKAKWEVPALRWADMTQWDESGQGRGVSILTDYKHGFDATPNQLRLTLLKASLWPDPTADRGWQTFTYAIYPHVGSWQEAKTVQQARNLNLPVRPWVQGGDLSTVEPSDRRCSEGQSLADTGSFLAFGETTWVLSAFKLAEDSDPFILRGYESAGVAGTLGLGGQLGLTASAMVTLLEQPMPTSGSGENAAEPEPGQIAISPWQVVSQEIRLKDVKLKS
ncbi:alpha-mannosidase [Phormidium sp. FACHB-1136]|uniref:alpha-mannosidase n=1 Tax=Phormidium sp. FACHB-1136 TaxID=2692848 RepID=UPI00168A2A7A|nr:alpha-mannosidase [Phormidium sp. FACHB-1136]MBD2426930.1 alpha-mannosidase [Phormidium sp. FACHB-1136]